MKLDLTQENKNDLEIVISSYMSSKKELDYELKE
jgi:hypothetical protein